MKKVWLSSTYYLDPKFEGISATTERLFTRLLAYCGNAETEGFLPRNVFKTVGLSNGNRSFIDLIQRGIIVPAEEGGHRFAAWSDWQDKGDKLVQRQKADRERKRKQRERQEQMSRDASRDVTPAEERREEKIEPTYVGSPSSVARRERPKGGREVAERLNGTAHSAQAHSMANAYANSCRQRPPGGVISKVAQAIDGCLQSGYDQQQIETGIAAWTASDMSAPSQIENFVHKSVNRNVNAGNATSKAEDWLTLGQQLHDEQRAINQ